MFDEDDNEPKPFPQDDELSKELQKIAFDAVAEAMVPLYEAFKRQGLSREEAALLAATFAASSSSGNGDE